MTIVPPGIEPVWDDNNWWQQQLVLQFEYGRQYEEHKQLELMASARGLGI